jgi:hypothetical protein
MLEGCAGIHRDPLMITPVVSLQSGLSESLRACIQVIGGGCRNHEGEGMTESPSAQKDLRNQGASRCARETSGVAGWTRTKSHPSSTPAPPPRSQSRWS